jgi:TrmH family RNA methyltransferase
MVASRRNARVKQIAALHAAAARSARGVIWVESRGCVGVALDAGIAVQELAVSDAAQTGVTTLCDRARARGIPVVRYTADCFARLSALRHPDGIGAVVAMPQLRSLDEIVADRVLVLWQLQDPGNQGSIVRSAVALGCSQIVLVTPCADVFHPACIRGSAGLLLRARLTVCGATAVRRWLAQCGAETVVLSADGCERLSDLMQHTARVLVVGNEARGIPADLRSRCRSLAIPMRNGAESLNVNAATAIALFALWNRAAVEA